MGIGPPRLLGTLATEQVDATFFIQGRWASASPEVSAGGSPPTAHLVGNHSRFTTPAVPCLTNEAIHNDIAAAEETIAVTTGCNPRPWFRCPWGDGHDDSRVLAAIAESGYRDCSWGMFDPNDWDAARTAHELVDDVTAGVEEHGDGGGRRCVHSVAGR